MNDYTLLLFECLADIRTKQSVVKGDCRRLRPNAHLFKPQFNDNENFFITSILDKNGFGHGIISNLSLL